MSFHISYDSIENSCLNQKEVSSIRCEHPLEVYYNGLISQYWSVVVSFKIYI